MARKTRETNIQVAWGLDSGSKVSAYTGLAFLDHMLTLLGTHGASFASELATACANHALLVEGLWSDDIACSKVHFKR